MATPCTIQKATHTRWPESTLKAKLYLKLSFGFTNDLSARCANKRYIEVLSGSIWYLL
jgi:hypothetical protein